MVDSEYVGREAAWVKHWMLEQYLERLIMKVATRWARFVYIDAYAGPWQSNASDLSDTSFARALQVMRSCQEAHARLGRSVPMKAIFCEKNASSAKRLISFAEQNTSTKIEVQAKHCDFGSHVDSVVDGIRDDDFVFALIDPTGFIAPSKLASLLRKRGVELLVNVMWDHANRFWNVDDASDALDNAFGVDRSELRKTMDGAAMFAAQLREFSAGKGGRLWSSSFPVQNPAKDRVHYYLVYATHSPMGLLTFDKVAESSWKVQALAKAEAKVRRAAPGPGLFGFDVHDAHVQRFVDTGRIRQGWIDLLSPPGKVVAVSDVVMADLLEKCNCLESDLQAELLQLCRDGQITNLSAKGKRPKNAVHWAKKEQLRLEK